MQATKTTIHLTPADPTIAAPAWLASAEPWRLLCAVLLTALLMGALRPAPSASAPLTAQVQRDPIIVFGTSQPTPALPTFAPTQQPAAVVAPEPTDEPIYHVADVQPARPVDSAAALRAHNAEVAGWCAANPDNANCAALAALQP